MALDGLVIHSIVHELQMCVGGRISKIHQPAKHDLILQIRSQGKNIKLLLSAHPTYPRIHTTEQNFQNPLEAPMFCMLLRKHCESGIIQAVKQVGTERIIHIDIRQRDELGDMHIKRLIIELMGRHSNIILMDPQTNRILDGIHHVTPAISAYRSVLPGVSYVNPPDQYKENPLAIHDAETFQRILEQSEDEHTQTAEHKQLGRAIVQRFSGISPLVANELVYRSEEQQLPLAHIFIEVMQHINKHQYEIGIVETAADQKTYFSVLELTHLNGQRKQFTSISACLEVFYGNKAERDTVKQRVSDMLKMLQNEKNKNSKKIDKLHKTLEKAKDADQYRIKGELLTATLHQVERGQSQIEVVNYYDPEQSTMQISLDPQLSPSENAQRYFRRYTKSKNSLSVVKEQIVQSKREINYIDSIQQQLNIASLSDIDEIREELIEQGYIRNRTKKQRKQKKKKNPSLQCYTSSEGIPIYVGKNNTQNEYLTSRLANASDTWLHTKDIPGSHVVIKSNSFGEATLEEAAMLAAYYSQAKESSQVPVDYTLIRHVRKPNGAKPGYVIYEQQKTLFVTPDEQRIKLLEMAIK